MDWNGKELQYDLAEHLRGSGWLTFTEIEVPGTEASYGRERGSTTSGRVDVAALKPGAYSRKDLRAYEVKVSRSDFLNDVNSQKYKRYLQVFHRVYFAVPKGLVTKDELPDGVGLITRSEKGWHVLKAAKGHEPTHLSVDSILALMYRGHEEGREIRRLEDRIKAEGNVRLNDRAINIGHMLRQRMAGKEDVIEEWALNVLEQCERFKGEKIDFDNHRYRHDEIYNILKLAQEKYDEVNIDEMEDWANQIARITHEVFGVNPTRGSYDRKRIVRAFEQAKVMSDRVEVLHKISSVLNSFYFHQRIDEIDDEVNEVLTLSDMTLNSTSG